MKKLLKSEVCRSRALFMRPTNGLKMAEKSKFSTTVHLHSHNVYMHIFTKTNVGVFLWLECAKL